MYLINASLKNIKTITLLLICFISFNAFANDVPKFLEMKGYAEQGDVKAQYNLAFMYDKGQGVIQDYKQSVKWYRKAAEQGNVRAQYNLAIMYRKGRGVIQSNNNSYIWNAIAAANGNERAIINRDLDAKILSPRGIEEAQEEAAKLYEKIYNK